MSRESSRLQTWSVVTGHACHDCQPRTWGALRGEISTAPPSTVTMVCHRRVIAEQSANRLLCVLRADATRTHPLPGCQDDALCSDRGKLSEAARFRACTLSTLPEIFGARGLVAPSPDLRLCVATVWNTHALVIASALVPEQSPSVFDAEMEARTCERVNRYASEISERKPEKRNAAELTAALRR